MQVKHIPHLPIWGTLPFPWAPSPRGEGGRGRAEGGPSAGWEGGES